MRKNRQRWLWALLTAFALALSAACSLTAATEPPKDKVAMVNGAPITRTDFDMEMSRVQQRFRASGRMPSGEELSHIKKRVIENLVARELLYQESKKKGYKADQETIDKQLSALKGRFSSEDEFKNALSRMKLTEEQVKSRLARDIATKQFIDEQFFKHVEVSEKEIKAYYESNPDAFKAPEQVRASHILIKVEPQADESKKAESRKKLEMIQQRVKKGEDFAALAREFSEGPSSTKGGDLGYFRRGQMVKPFEEAAFGLKPGEVSDIVETRFGYHLIKVVDKKPETQIGYEEVKERIEAFLKQQETQNQINLYVENLKKDAKVEIFLVEEGK